MPVAYEYKLHKEIFVGMFPANPRSLFLKGADLKDPLESLTKQMPNMSSSDELLKSPDALLKELNVEGSEIIGEEERKVFDSLIGDGNNQSGDGKNKKKKKLIEEISELYFQALKHY